MCANSKWRLVRTFKVSRFTKRNLRAVFFCTKNFKNLCTSPFFLYGIYLNVWNVQKSQFFCNGLKNVAIGKKHCLRATYEYEYHIQFCISLKCKKNNKYYSSKIKQTRICITMFSLIDFKVNSNKIVNPPIWKINKFWKVIKHYNNKFANISCDLKH